jgi:cysteine desulfurase
MIYLDTAASYPMLPEVKQSLNEAFEYYYANSASSHLLGEQVSDEINKVREQLADQIGAYPSEIVFTSGATESNNIAFKSLLLSNEIAKEKKHIVTTQVEHKCVFVICDYLKSIGYEITYVKPNRNGIIETDAITNAIRPDTALVSVMHVNNELGTINPIDEIGQVCFDTGILFHSDAAQSFQKVDIDVDDLNVDVMSFSAHKIGGPKGIGAVYIRDLRKKHLMPVIHGAGQEEGFRGGTVAAPLIIGFGAAINYFTKYYFTFKSTNIKEYLLNRLKEENIKFIVNGTNTLVSCLSITLPETDTETLVRKNESILCLAQGSASQQCALGRYDSLSVGTG